MSIVPVGRARVPLGGGGAAAGRAGGLRRPRWISNFHTLPGVDVGMQSGRRYPAPAELSSWMGTTPEDRSEPYACFPSHTTRTYDVRGLSRGGRTLIPVRGDSLDGALRSREEYNAPADCRDPHFHPMARGYRTSRDSSASSPTPSTSASARGRPGRTHGSTCRASSFPELDSELGYPLRRPGSSDKGRNGVRRLIWRWGLTSLDIQ